MGRRLLVALVVLALAGFTGCGGEETVSPAPETVEGTVEQETVPDLAQGDPEAGREVFTDVAQPGCGTCHTYEAAGTDAEIGPDLDEALQGDDPETIYNSIVNPDDEITEGFADNLMPEDYGEKLDDKQLADLVAFLTPQS